jgi:hypothetical protein
VTQVAEQENLTLRFGGKSARWATAGVFLAGIGTGAAAILRAPYANQWSALSACCGLGAIWVAFGFFGRRVDAGPDGLRYRTVIRWHRLAWDEILRLETIQVMPNDKRSTTPNLRVEAELRSGEAVRLPVPWAGMGDPFAFEDQMRALRKVRRRYTEATPQLP